MKHGTIRQVGPTASYAASGLVLAIALTVLAGWYFHLPLLRRFSSGYVSMNPATAFCLATAAVSLVLLTPAEVPRRRKLAGRTLAAVVLSIGLVRLIGAATGWHSGIDQWLFASDLGGAGVEPPSRMAFRSALSFVLVAVGLMLLDKQTRHGRRPTELLCAIFSAIAFLALFAYAYGLFVYYKSPDFLPMSLPGSIAFLLLATAMLLARPNAGVMRIITSDSPAGLLLRLLLPLAVLLPVLLGALRFGGEHAGWYSTRIGVALFTTVFIALFFASVAWTTRLLVQSDRERKAAEERVCQVNAELEQRVADRTAELHMLNDELVAAGKTKDNFLAALSHELRTPLTPVLMTAATLRNETRLPLDVREQLGMIQRNIELEARLIDDLLDLTRIARGKLQLRSQPCDAHSLVALSIEMVRSEASRKRQTMEIDLAAQHSRLLGDPARLQQVFWNLLKNAVKFTPESGQLAVRSRDGDGTLTLEISDTGIGFEAEAIERIFLPFEQAAALMSDRRFGGLGLGLAISKAVVDLHGGRIQAQSAGPGKGAVFRVELPVPGDLLIDNIAPGSAETNGERPAQRARFTPLRLLLVEDHEPTLAVLERLLTRAGHSVATAMSVAGALQTASGPVTFDALISDVGLPDGTGLELMEKLRTTYGLCGIALSGYGMDEDLRRSREAGFSAHLTKPIDFAQFEQALADLTASHGVLSQRTRGRPPS